MNFLTQLLREVLTRLEHFIRGIIGHSSITKFSSLSKLCVCVLFSMDINLELCAPATVSLYDCNLAVGRPVQDLDFGVIREVGCIHTLIKLG